MTAGLGLVAGPLADRLGYRRSLLLALACLSLSALGTGLAPSLVVLLLATVVGAIGRAPAPLVARAIAGARFDGDARRRAMSWVTGGVSVALVGGVPLLTLLDTAVGWRAAFASLALLVAGSAVLVRWALAQESELVSTTAHPGGLLAAYLPIARHRATAVLLGGQVFGLAGTGTLLTYLGAFLAERHGFTIQQVGWAYLALGIGSLLGTMVVASRLGSRPLRQLMVQGRVTCGALGATALLLPAPGPVIAGLLALCAVLMAVCNVAAPILLAEETPGGQATTMALNTATMGVGNAAGASLGGLLLAVGGYSTLGLAVAAWYSISAILIWWSGPRQVTENGRACPRSMR